MLCCTIVINLQLARKDSMIKPDHTAVNLNDWNNQHCTQGCDCFFVGGVGWEGIAVSLPLIDL